MAQQRMPQDSLWPLLLALGVTAVFYGLVFGVGWLAVGGTAWVAICMAGWFWPHTQDGEPTAVAGAGAQ